jgi:aminoglycoside 3-N-acetyltransferase
MDNKGLYRKIIGLIDEKYLTDNIEKLWKTEIGQTFKDYHNAAKLAFSLMKKAGLSEVEKIAFPADGKTAYQDKVSPLAWDATCGRMTILKSPVALQDNVVADYQRHPFHLIKGSISTPPDGLNIRLITLEQLSHGQEARNTMVILDTDTLPRDETVRYILDSGAIGWVNTSVEGKHYITPDGIGWMNASTEGPQWHVHSDDRPFIGFCVSPRTGDVLLSAAKQGEVTARIECDGKRYKGKVDIVTGIIPGREKKEFWLLAHLYEPLPDDNSLGVIASISIAKILKKLFDSGVLPEPRFTLRLISGLEMYGFAAYADRRGKNLKNEVIGAINLDGFGCRKGEVVDYWMSPQGSPFFGNYLVEDMTENIPVDILPDVNITLKKEGNYSDDMFLADSTTGIPTVWPLTRHFLHHNSYQTMEVLEPSVIKQHVTFQSSFVARIMTIDKKNEEFFLKQACLRANQHLLSEFLEVTESFSEKGKTTGEDIKEARVKIGWCYEKERKQIADFMDVASGETVSKALKLFSRTKKDLLYVYGLADNKNKNFSRPFPEKNEVWWKIAETIIPARVSTGFPYDLAKVPREERKKLPDNCIYGPLSMILANMDGKKNLKHLILQAEWESKKEITASEVRKYLGAIEFLSEYGYIKNRYTLSIREKNIVTALKKTGLKPGDLLIVHSGLSHFGHIEGGADTVIDAFLEVLGKEGTLLLPTFTGSYIYFNGDCLAGRKCHPYDRNDTTVNVGKIPSVFLRRKGVIRSSHPSHSVAGIGPLAEKCLMEHQPSDPPVCRRSPFGKLLEYSGKMVWFGAGLSTTTFFHFLEDELDMPYLAEAVCRVKKADGNIGTILIKKHLPGHRDFYRNPAEETKMYQRLLQKGLVIKKAELGFGEIKVIDTRQMYELGIESLKEEPTLLLCDNKECTFCSRYNKTERS